MVSEFECTIHRSNNLDSNEKFGDNSPIYIKGQDIGKIVPEIVSYSTADKTVDYSDSTKVPFEIEKKVRYVFDEREIEFLNNKFNYGLKSYLVLPQKLSKSIYLDKDGELKHYEGAFPYGGMYKLNESEEFQEDKVEFENSFGYMRKYLLTTLTDSEKRTKYFSMIKANKKLSKKIIAGVVAVVTAIAIITLSVVLPPKINEYNLHKYDGIWLLDNDVKKGYIESKGKDVKFAEDVVAETDDSYWFGDIYTGKRDGDKITYTFHAKMSNHYYDVDLYSEDDYEIEDDFERVVWYKKIGRNKLKINDKYVFVKLIK